MGANFQTTELDGKLSFPEVVKAFINLQDTDRYENGHSYSGGFGMASGISYRNENFPTIEEGIAWLSEHTEKWDNALCIKAGVGTEARWVIGALCAS
jgi:hypothetical protein